MGGELEPSRKLGAFDRVTGMNEISTELLQVLAGTLGPSSGRQQDTRGSRLEYSGDPSEDLPKLVSEFKRWYAHDNFNSFRRSTGNEYIDTLEEQKHLCTSFLKLCSGRAKAVASKAFDALSTAERDLPEEDRGIEGHHLALVH